MEKKFKLSIILNGSQYSVFSSQIISFLNLIKFFNYNKKLVVLELNGKIYHSKIWENLPIRKKDNLELLTIVGGG